MSHHEHDHDHDHEHDQDVTTRELSPEELGEEQEQIAREVGAELTEAFVDYVHGKIDFEDLTFGVFDALSDLSVVASGEYELESVDDDEDDVEE